MTETRPEIQFQDEMYEICERIPDVEEVDEWVTILEELDNVMIKAQSACVTIPIHVFALRTAISNVIHTENISISVHQELDALKYKVCDDMELNTGREKWTRTKSE